MNADPSIMAACPDVGETTGNPSVGGTATHLFTRTSGDGVTIRVYRLAATDIGCGPVPVSGGPVSPAPSCVSSQQVSIEMSDATAVGLGDLGWSVASPSSTGSSPSTQLQSTSAGAFGVAEGDPVWWVAIQVGPEVAKAEVTFADGSTDEMAPVDGVVVLADHVSVGATSDPDSVTGSVELFDGSGAVLSTLPLPQQQVPVLPVPVPSPGPVVNGSGAGAGSGSSSAGQAGPTTTTSGVTGSSASSPPVGAGPDDTTFACPMIPAAGLPSTPTTAPGASSSSPSR